jgi:hypothetical protein
MTGPAVAQNTGDTGDTGDHGSDQDDEPENNDHDVLRRFTLLPTVNALK